MPNNLQDRSILQLVMNQFSQITNHFSQFAILRKLCNFVCEHTVFILWHVHVHCTSAGRGVRVYYILNKVVGEESEYTIKHTQI